MQYLIGIVLGTIIAIVAWKAGALARSGAWAAAITGGVIFGFGGLPWAVLLVVFFVSSSALSQLFARRKSAMDEKYAKGSRRDWGQVIANGGLGTLLAIAATVFPGQERFWLMYAGAMAAVNADTWATELGFFNPGSPRLITSGKPVEKGTSGGVSFLGYIAVLAGSALIGIAAAIFTPGIPPFRLILAVTAGGLVGSTIDSLLGATVQAIYYCPTCNKETERHPLHTCGTQTMPARGWRWLNNDWVNWICSLAGALTTVLLSGLLL